MKTCRIRSSSSTSATQKSIWSPPSSGLQFPFEEELGGFRAIHRHDPSRGESEQLPADFRTDAAGAAGDQDNPPVDPLPNVLDRQPHRFALQQVFDRDRPGLNRHAPFDQLPVVGQHADLAGAAPGVVHEFAELRSGKIALRDQDLPYRMATDQPAACSQAPITGMPSIRVPTCAGCRRGIRRRDSAAGRGGGSSAA